MIPVLRFFTIVPGMITPANTGIHSGGYGIMKYNKEIKIPEIYIVHNSRCVWCVVVSVYVYWSNMSCGVI